MAEHNPPDNDRYLPHLIIAHNGQSETFKSPSGGGDKAIPARDRHAHGQFLLQKMQRLQADYEQRARETEQDDLVEGLGLQVEFAGFPDVELAFDKLARERSGIELRNVRHLGDRTLATVFVPDGKLVQFENRIRAYLDETRDNKSGPKHANLLNTIADIRAAALEALWTDDPALFPESDEQTLWWEVWLPAGDERQARLTRFKQAVIDLGMEAVAGQIDFPERSVLLVRGSAEQWKRSPITLNSIAELRCARATADFFDALPPEEQPPWVDDLKNRLTLPTADDDVPHVCVLDTGVNRGHPLLTPALEKTDLHSVDPNWGENDRDGHGTEMAGLALLGDLTEPLESTEPVTVSHRLESVKLLPDDDNNHGEPEFHAQLMLDAVSRPVITAAHRQRLFSMAVTARDHRDRGRPTAWSACVDRLAYDAGDQAANPRLIIVSAGNINDPNAWNTYPDSNTSDSIHDPAQAWNALTVGATTWLDRITEADANHYQPIAEAGGLSPFSTTSATWQPHWPLKPDVVFEGGNVGWDGLGSSTMPSLHLLTTNANPNERLLTTSNATSAACAQAARMAARLMAEYPSFRPETIRGLMVHMAEWTPAMKQMFLPTNGSPNKAQIENLVRHCGFGEPDLARALHSASNSLTLVCEEQLHPFYRHKTSDVRYREMNLHDLPWPTEELQALGETEVELRVTLSYFIEPSPSARGPKSRYLYESHGLRFDVRRPLEPENDFRARINAEARDKDDDRRTSTQDNAWLVGKNNRHKGSIHSDIWRGTAVDLASRGMLAVYPSKGWWQTRKRHERYDLPVHYALLISIQVPEVDVDLYTPVENLVKVPISVG